MLRSLCFLPVCLVSAQAGQADWVSLFNGQDLSGWSVYTGWGADDNPLAADEIFVVSDGVIRVYPEAQNGSPQ